MEKFEDRIQNKIHLVRHKKRLESRYSLKNVNINTFYGIVGHKDPAGEKGAEGFPGLVYGNFLLKDTNTGQISQ